MLVLFVLVLEYSIEDTDSFNSEGSLDFFLFFLHSKVDAVEFNLHVGFSLVADIVPAHLPEF